MLGSSTDFTGITFTVSSNVIPGNNYNFRIRAKNKWGWGSFSSIVTIRASDVPAQPLAPITSIDSLTGNFVITWIAPNTRNDPITQYIITIRNKAGTTWTEDLTNCNGLDTTVI